MHIITTDPLKSPVVQSELIDWAKLDSDDPTIGSCLTMATGAVIAFLKQELEPRTYTLTTMNTTGKIELPYANLLEVVTVTVGGEVTTDYTINKGKPYSITLNSITTDEVVIGYKAGFNSVPTQIRDAIKLVATYYHKNSGCTMGEAVEQSGAKPLLVPYAVNGGIVI